ncbi:MAG: gas vesicle protein GvpN [Planctomycetota bacterium]
MVPEPSDGFVNSARVASVTERAMAYLTLGYPVHMAGPAGTGKTTLAFHIAAQLGRPVSLIHGNDELGTGDLIGKDSGYTKSTVIDNYVSSVLKTNEDLSVKWSDNRLTEACEQGHTLIYDEFNRTTAEANNILLSILEEKVLNLPKAGGSYLRVHPEFRLILTSNPAEYAGVHRTQDALMDRLITIDCGHYDAQTEAAITAARSGVDETIAAGIVALAAQIRTRTEGGHRPTVRGCIALGKVLASAGRTLSADDPFVEAVAWDLLGHDLADAGVDRSVLAELIGSVMGPANQAQGKTAQSTAPAPIVETKSDAEPEPRRRQIKQKAA